VADDIRYTGTVRAVEISNPRGGRWTFPALFLAILVWNAYIVRFDWLVVASWALAFAIACFNAWRLSKRGYSLFQAMAAGIVFGLDPITKVPWSQVQELRISALRGGALLEIVLSPSAPVVYRSLLRQAADLPLALFWSLRRRHYVPELALPRRNPPRYLIPLLKVSQAELRSELSRLAPRIPIVMVWASPRA
jgi:hypothetical protein